MITSLDNKKVKEWTKLHIKKYREDFYLLLDEDIVDIAYKCGYLKTLIYCGNKPFEFIDSYEVSEEVLYKIAKKENIKYLGIATKIKESDDYKSRVIILDELQDPLNIGRIIDNAYQFGFDSVILSENSADFYHEKAIEASKGNLYKINIKRCDIAKEIEVLKNKGFKIYATGLRNETISLTEVKKEEKMAFILGNEGSGVEEKIFDLSDEIIKIDMHNIDSLNVAMAASIIMYEFNTLQ